MLRTLLVSGAVLQAAGCVWDQTRGCDSSGCWTCQQRAEWLERNRGLSRAEAVWQIAVDEFPGECGQCAPCSWEATLACDRERNCHTCGSRARWLQSARGMSFAASVHQIARVEYPAECGRCAPGATGTPPPPPPPPPATGGGRLRVGTYNLFGWNALTHAGRREQLFAHIRELEMDVLGTQETHGKSGLAAGATGLQMAVGESSGLQIFYRAGVVRRLSAGVFNIGTENQDGDSDPWGMRQVVWAVLEAHGREFVAFNTHWCVCPRRGDALYATARYVSSRMAGIAGPRPVLFTGDLNIAPGSRAVNHLTSSAAPLPLVDSAPAGGTLGGSRIDFVMTHDMRIVERWIGRQSTSDHKPSLAVIEV